MFLQYCIILVYNYNVRLNCIKFSTVISEFNKNGIKCTICTLDFHIISVRIEDTSQLSSWICNSCDLFCLRNHTQLNSPSILMDKIYSMLIKLKRVKTTVNNHENSFISINSKMYNVSTLINSLFEENK